LKQDLKGEGIINIKIKVFIFRHNEIIL
jgi:hypothetical protein